MNNESDFASLTLRIQTSILRTEEISQILQMLPTKSHSRGERMSARNPSSAVYEQNLWLFEFKEKSLDALLIEVGDFVEKNQMALLLLAEKCSLDLFCGYSPKESQDSFFISQKTLRQIAGIPVDIIFDVYASS